MSDIHGRESDSGVAMAIEALFDDQNGKLWIRIRKPRGDNTSSRATYGCNQSFCPQIIHGGTGSLPPAMTTSTVSSPLGSSV